MNLHFSLRKILLPVLFILIYFSLQAQSGYPSFCNIKDYGAAGDGVHPDNMAINAAIMACAKGGGGTVIVPAGNYLCGSIHLMSNINLLIDAGAVIKGAPPEMNLYDSAEAFPYVAYQDGGHTYFHNSLIWGENLVNISITGRGMIDGGGLTSRDREASGNPTGGSIGTGDKSIALKLCTNVLIRDIVIIHGGHFAILATGCNLLTLDNLTIDTNRDGIDVDCCTNTIISNCRVNSPNDDAICPKSSFALNRAVVTENLVITNCEVSGFKEGSLMDGTPIAVMGGWSSGRIKFGTESNGGFKNCVVSNCTFRNCNGLALEEVDGGVMDNIVVANITMINVYHYPIYITLGKRNRGPVDSTVSGMVKNIQISNVSITCADSLSGIQITGSPGSAVENVRLQNIQITYNGGGTPAQGERFFPELARQYPEPSLLGINPAYGLYARHVKNLELADITFYLMKTDARPALIFTDVDGLEIDHFKAPSGMAAQARFEKVKSLIISRSPVLAGIK